MNKPDFWVNMLHEFITDHYAAEAALISLASAVILRMYCALLVSKVFFWWSRPPRWAWLLSLNNEVLRAFMEAHLETNTLALRVKLVVVHTTVGRHLEWINKIKKMQKWEPYDLTFTKICFFILKKAFFLIMYLLLMKSSFFIVIAELDCWFRTDVSKVANILANTIDEKGAQNIWKRGTKHLISKTYAVRHWSLFLFTEPISVSLPFLLGLRCIYAPVGVDQIRNAFCQFDSLWHKSLSLAGNIMSVLMVLNFTCCFPFLSTLYLGVTNYDKYMRKEMCALIHLMVVGGCWVQSC